MPVPVADGGTARWRPRSPRAPPGGHRGTRAGRKDVTASFALLGGTAVIEAAQACGLTLLPPGCPRR